MQQRNHIVERARLTPAKRAEGPSLLQTLSPEELDESEERVE